MIPIGDRRSAALVGGFLLFDRRSPAGGRAAVTAPSGESVPLITDDARAGAPAPPVRVAFVGQSVYFRQCALEQPLAGVEPVFLDFRAGAPAEPLLGRAARARP